MSPIMRTFALLSVLSGGLCLGQTPTVNDFAPGPDKVPKSPVSFDLSAIDKAVSPCDNFYQYACGNWLKNNPIPADRTRWGRFDELTERNTYVLYNDLKAAADSPKSPLQTKYGNFFAACMNVGLADRAGARPIDSPLEAIDTWSKRGPNATSVARLVLQMQQDFGTGLFFSFGSDQDQKDSSQEIGAVDQGGLSLPDRDFYLSTSDRMIKIRAAYLEHVTKMFILLGDTPDQAVGEAKAVMTIETALAEGSMARVDRRIPANVYHVMTIPQLQGLNPAFDWKTYLSGQHEGTLTTVNVVSPGFFKALNQQLSSAGVPAVRSYLRWHVLHRFAPNLSEPFVTENFRFFRQTIAGQKEQTPRWKLCTSATDRALGEAVGQDWVKQNFPPAAKANMEKLVHALELALDQDIQQIDWMSDATKVEAKKKLMAFRDKIGYPEKWRNYDALLVKRDDPVGNSARASEFLDRRDLNKIGKPVDEKEWDMTPPTVNAYYNPAQNDINFPGGILQPPFYDVHADPAINFGGIGVVIGHEMTHGFDDQGSQYDPQGNVRMWWTAQDKKKFDSLTDCEVKEYTGFQVAPGAHLNGKLTLGENTADNGGLHIAYQALLATLAEQGQSPSSTIATQAGDFTPAQQFFISFGQVWCQNATEQQARLSALTDPHSSGEWRANGSVQNSEAFTKAFSCKAGQPMAPRNACHVW